MLFIIWKKKDHCPLPRLEIAFLAYQRSILNGWRDDDGLSIGGRAGRKVYPTRGFPKGKRKEAPQCA